MAFYSIFVQELKNHWQLVNGLWFHQRVYKSMAMVNVSDRFAPIAPIEKLSKNFCTIDAKLIQDTICMLKVYISVYRFLDLSLVGMSIHYSKSSNIL